MTNNKIYRGGEKETREAMKDAFISGDWSGWEIEICGISSFVSMEHKYTPYIFDDDATFRRKQRTMMINGVEVPMPACMYERNNGVDLNVEFNSEADLDQFEAVMREVMESTQ